MLCVYRDTEVGNNFRYISGRVRYTVSSLDLLLAAALSLLALTLAASSHGVDYSASIESEVLV
jgi:hypothetical protein